MPPRQSFTDFMASLNPQPPRTEAEAALVRIDQLLGPKGVESSTPVSDYGQKVWDRIFRAPEFVRRGARRFSDWMTTPELDDSDIEARIKGFIGGGVEGAGELLSPFNIATTLSMIGPAGGAVSGLRAAMPTLRGVAQTAGIVGAGPLAVESIKHLEDVARNYDRPRLPDEMSAGTEMGLAAGQAGAAILGAVAPFVHPPPAPPTFRGQPTSLPPGRHSIYPQSRNVTPSYRDPWALQRTNRLQFTEGDFYEIPPGGRDLAGTAPDPRLLTEGDFGNQVGPGPTPLGPSPLGGPPRAPFSPRGPFVGGIPDEGMAPAPLNAPPSIRGLLEAQAGPSRTAGGGLEAPGEIGPGWAPWMRGDEPPAPPPANRPQGPPPRPSSPDAALQDEAIQAFMEGDVARGLELAAEARNRQWYDENWFQLPPEPPAVEAPPLPGAMAVRPTPVMGRTVTSIEFIDPDNVALVWGTEPTERIRMPIKAAQQFFPELPTPERPAPPPDRFDIYPPDQRDAMRARVAEIEALLRPEQGQQGLEFQGPVVGETPGRPETPLDALERMLTERGFYGPRDLTPEAPVPSQGPLPLPAPETAPARTFRPPAGPLTAAPETARPVAPLGTTGAPPVEAPPPPPAPVQRPASGAEQAVASKRGGMVPPEQRMSADDLEVDPATFQFKESDVKGITGALKGVQEWDDSSPPLQVYETVDGRRFVADGHQRYNKYLELQARGDELPPLKVRVWREADGFTVEDMVRLASLRNVQEGSAKPLDIARMIWNGGELSPQEVARIPKVNIAGERLARGQALGNITDPRARQMLINHEVDQNYASFVGKYISDPAEQLAALQKLAKAELGNLDQAEAFVRSLADQEFQQVGLEDLFGGQDVMVPLAETKAKLIDDVRKMLGERRAAFAGALRHADELAAAGNQLLGDVNVANLDEAKKLLAYFDKLSLAKGTHTNAALTEAARTLVSGGGDRTAHHAAILEAIKRDLSGQGPPGAAGAAGAAPTARPVAPERPGQPPGGAGEGAPPTGLGQLLGVEEAPKPIAEQTPFGQAIVERLKPKPPGETLEAVGKPGPLGQTDAVEAPPPPQKVAEAMPTPPPPPGGGADRSPLWRSLRGQAERDLAGGDIGAFSQAEIKELTDRLKIGFGEVRRRAVAGELDAGDPAVQAALDAIATAREAGRPPMKAAQNGEFLAPPDKDYVFVRLDEDFAHSPDGAKVRDALRKAGYRFDYGQRAWFKNRRGGATPEQLEAEAAELLGGPKLEGADILDTGEVQPRLPGDVGDVRDVENAQPEFEAPFTLGRENAPRPKPSQPSVFQPVAEETPLGPAIVERVPESLRQQKPPADLGELLTGEAAKPVTPAKPIAEVPPAAEGATTLQQLPANVRAFLQRQLGYSPDDINGMTVEEAMQIGRDRVRKPQPPAAEPEAAEPVPSPQPDVAPPAPPSAAGAGRAPQSLEELLTGYLEEAAPLKVEQAQRRMKAAQKARGEQKVPVRQTYRGGFPKESEMEVPARVAKPYRARTIKELDEAIAEGRQVESAEYEAALEAEAKARLEQNKARAATRPEEGLVEQERDARGLPPVKRGELEGATKHKDALHKGGVTRANAKRAYAMQRMLEDGSPAAIDEYARALTEQVARENEQALKWGAAENQEGQKKWGDEFTRLKPDKETGEYLGSGFGVLQKLWDQDPGLVLRSAGGAITGLVLANEEDFDKQLAVALMGGAAGAAMNPRLARQLFAKAKTEMPRVVQSIQQQWKNAKKPSKEWELNVRAPRDYSKDIGVFQQLRSITAVDPDLFRDLFNIAKNRAAAVTPGMTPEQRRIIAKMYDQEARSHVRAAMKLAEKMGHKREARYLKAYHDMLAGKPSWLAEAISSGTLGSITASQAEKAISQANRQIYRTLIGLAVDTALVNRSQVLLNLPRLGLKGTVKGIVEGRTAAGKAQAAKAGMHYEHFADLPTTPQGELMDAIDNVAFRMMHWSDEANRADTYLGARKWATERGYSAEQAENFALDLTMQTQGIPGDLAGNPYIHHFAGPFRALAKYPTMWAEFAADILTHPDKKVAARGLAYLLGISYLGAKVGLDLYDVMVPRASFLGPGLDVAKAIPEKVKKVAEGDWQGVVEDVAKAFVPRYVTKAGEVIKARVPESLGGYGEGMGTRPKFDRRGYETGETRSATEDLKNLLGLRTPEQTERTKERQEMYEFERREREQHQAASVRATRKLRDAIERNDDKAIREAESALTPNQLRNFYRSGQRPERQRIERRLSKEQRERFRQRFGEFSESRP